MLLMVALTEAERIYVRDSWMRKRNMGSITKPELIDAINATDDWINNNQLGFNAALPEPFKSIATIEQKTMIFCYVAMKRAGILPKEGL